MYFDTIHDLEKFDDICEDGYTSYWETDTEVDEELGNFLFDNVAGDSASVICIDEAMDLIAMREQHNQRESPIQVDHYSVPQNPQHFSSEIHRSVHPHVQEEHMMERSNENKRSTAFRQSRRSHNSGSDGAYDEPPPVPPPRRQISSPPALSPEEHTYETLDDCQEEYAIYIAKGSDGSRGSGGSTDSTAKPVECDERLKATNGSSKSPVQSFKKPRSMSTPQPLEGIQIRHRRKLSEPVSTDYSSSRKRRSEKVCPSKSSFPPPVRGYQLPPGIPEDYPEYTTIPATTSPDRRSPHHYTSVPPTSPTRRGLSTDRLARVENRKSTASSSSGKPGRAPSLFIRHKGKTYFIPVLDKKLQQKLEKVKGPPETYSHLVQRHNTINTSISRSSSGISTGVYQAPSLAQRSMRSHASPPKVDPCEQATSHKRKNSKTSQHQNSAPKQVTHYGVL